MQTPPTAPTDELGRQLVLDEIFDLALYRSLQDAARGDLRGMLDELIRVEERHVAFWQEFFGLQELTVLDLPRRLKLAVLHATCSLFGANAIHDHHGDGGGRDLRHRAPHPGHLGHQRLEAGC